MFPILDRNSGVVYFTSEYLIREALDFFHRVPDVGGQSQSQKSAQNCKRFHAWKISINISINVPKINV